VVFVPVFLALFWRRKISTWAWGGVLASFAGLYFLTVPRQGIHDLNRGDMLVLGCAVLYALQIILISRYSAELSLASLSFLQVAVTAVMSLLAVPLLDATGWEPLRFHLTSQMIFGVLVTAVFTTAIAYPLLVWGQRHITATNTALILATEPVYAAITSFVVIHERLGARALVGAGLILAGILVAELKGPIPASEEIRHDAWIRPKALNLTVIEAAKGLGVTRKTLSSILNGRSGITAEMALRLSKAFGSTPEHWLR